MTGHHERATCPVRQKQRTRARWMRTGTENLRANFTALPNRASMASPARWPTIPAGGSSYLPAGQLSAWGRGIALVARQFAD